MKNNKNGITLIALVITIIVLLILAGISISLVTGQNGVLTRAEDASNTYSISSAKEQASMRIAGYISEYMEKVYVNNDSTVGAMSTGEYVLSQINGEEDGDYSYSVSGSTITVTSKTTGETLASGTIGDDGGIAWSDNVASGENTNTNTSTNNQENASNPNNTTNTNTSNNQGNTNNGGSNTNNQSTIIIGSKITAGQLAGYSNGLATIGTGTIADDWYVLNYDTNNVYVMYGDYLPNACMPEGTGITKSSYNVNGDSQSNLVNYMTTTSNWSSFANLFKNSTAIPEGTNTDGIVATGSPTTGKVNTAKNTQTLAAVSWLNPHYNSSGNAWNSCKGYWLASANPNSTFDVYAVNYGGYFDSGTSSSAHFGVRPVVSIPISIFQNFTTTTD